MVLENRVAIVTGAAQGIGAATARKLAEAGARVVLADIDGSRAETVAASLRDAERHALAQTCDVGRPADCEQLVRDTVARFGRLDILVNNAAICPRIDVDEMTEAQFDAIVDTNLKSVFFLSRAAANAMKPNRWGRIVNLSSTSGRVGGFYRAAVYGATKAAILSLTKTLARHYAPDNILVNAVAPGAVATRLLDLPDEIRRAQMNLVPLGRFADPAEVAAVIAFLCTDEAGWMTGATVDVNGGQVMV